MKHIAYCDGSITKNPGGIASAGWEIDGQGYSRLVAESHSTNSNWTAEYGALVYCLTDLLPYRQKQIELHTDLMVLAAWCNAKKKKDTIKAYGFWQRQAKELLEQFSDLTIKWIPREENRADPYSKLECLI